MTENRVIDWLTYRSYEANRLRTPYVQKERWRAIYEQALQFEEVFENYLKNKEVKNVSNG